jgi:hypothetical protein
MERPLDEGSRLFSKSIGRDELSCSRPVQEAQRKRRRIHAMHEEAARLVATSTAIVGVMPLLGIAMSPDGTCLLWTHLEANCRCG